MLTFPGVVDSVDPQTLSYEQVPGFLSKESNLSRFKGPVPLAQKGQRGIRSSVWFVEWTLEAHIEKGFGTNVSMLGWNHVTVSVSTRV